MPAKSDNLIARHEYILQRLQETGSVAVDELFKMVSRQYDRPKHHAHCPLELRIANRIKMAELPRDLFFSTHQVHSQHNCGERRDVADCEFCHILGRDRSRR